MMRKVITYGTFDLLHPGHVNLLRRAKDLGDYLVVAISTDDFNLLKHKESFYSYAERKLLIESIKYVDEVIAENTWEQKQNDIEKYDIDILVMGNDWEGNFDDLRSFCEVVYLDRTPNISTTQIKKQLKK